MNNEKKYLLGLTLAELKQVAKDLGMPAFTGGQMAKWLYQQHVKSIDEMTNISKANRAKLAEEYEIGCFGYSDAQHSVDGTIKYLFPTRSGKFVETVYIPDKDRATLCVSSQVGCKMNCLFCQTGKQGFEGSLPAGDILNQIYSLPEVDKLTNIVFMGQGEPMDNLDNVLRATDILTADYGWAWSPKRITVSSVGVKNKLKRFLEESECHVAISMHDPIPAERAELMPAERGMGIEQVVELLRNYDFSHQRRLSFEYIVFKGLNDSMQHAKAIIRLVKGLDCRFNLIRFHQIPDIPLQGVSDEKMEQFRDYLTQHGVFTTIRASRGQDIYAACGLLSTSKKIGEIRQHENEQAYCHAVLPGADTRRLRWHGWKKTRKHRAALRGGAGRRQRQHRDPDDDGRYAASATARTDVQPYTGEEGKGARKLPAGEKPHRGGHQCS